MTQQFLEQEPISMLSPKLNFLDRLSDIVTAVLRANAEYLLEVVKWEILVVQRQNSRSRSGTKTVPEN